MQAGARRGLTRGDRGGAHRGRVSGLRRRHDRRHDPARGRHRGSRAISMTKGCYVGQEVIIRVLHRGHGRVARKLVSLRVDGAAPERGARLFAADRDVGFVTSAAASPRLGTIAMGYVHRDFVAPGTSGRGRDRSPAACRPPLPSGADSVRSLISSSSAGGKPSVAQIGCAAPTASPGRAAAAAFPAACTDRSTARPSGRRRRA